MQRLKPPSHILIALQKLKQLPTSSIMATTWPHPHFSGSYGNHALIEAPNVARDIVIVVMGSTGAGKSSFINLVSGSNLDVGEALRSQTTLPQPAYFELFGRRVVLIDTPGFDDTERNDAEVLDVIGKYLSVLHSQGLDITAVVYLHRISDNRVAGSALNNLRMCQAICGDSAIKNLIVCTTMWEQVLPGVGEAREKELLETEQFWGRAIQRGARSLRHFRTRESAEAIIRATFGYDPVVLAIQHELVEEGKLLMETTAGVLVDAAIRRLQAKHQAQLTEIDADYQKAVRQKDLALQQELDATRQSHRVQLWQMENQQRLLEESLHLRELQLPVASRPHLRVHRYLAWDMWRYLDAVTHLLILLGRAVGGVRRVAGGQPS
ncbi:hypothetical protein BOTBODRAFT_179944 [Botryobasidium botryosum FD-172 SS1]|uniref:G domain-containing protein n=1 Tax=Botryobasidium botryosum (strain FD-172 SS1) TaxID=930990 RepID=A0A067M0X9_BOTB1|nr:hypothetical protein BOTBODRAFT_179944 [Botryobasidium botryosum FD-172 SS1]